MSTSTSSATALIDATPWRVTTEPPRGRRKTIYLRARRTNRDSGKREEIRGSSSTTDPSEAKRLAEEWEAFLNGCKVGADPTVLSVLDARLAHPHVALDLEPSTVAKYQRLRAVVSTLPLADVRASQLSRRHLIAAQDAIRSGGRKGSRAPSTTNSYLEILAAAWHWAFSRELVTSPWPRIEALDESRPARPKRAYTNGEVGAILDHVRSHEPRWYPVFALLSATGARLNDVLSLRGRDVLRTEGVVLLRDPKTHDPIDAGVPGEVMAVLPDCQPDAYLFPSRSPQRVGLPVTDSGALRCLRRTLRALKLPDPEWLDLHSFRRAWCAASEEAGVPRHQAMKQTGHKTAAMFDHYAGKARRRARETAERVHAYRAQVVGRLGAEGGAA